MSVKWDYMAELSIAASQRDEALARAERIANRAVMLESRLAEVTRLLKRHVYLRGEWVQSDKDVLEALVVAEEGERDE